MLMIALAGIGLMALLGGTALVWRPPPGRVRGSDPVALGRVLQAAGVALLVGALLVRPDDP
ncbi:MAG TPA: hypothetical protein VHG51_21580 [Longimicrobiaceae bacterium]|nr:hypothetical protein [Longimicrobiaceae bacterium]